MIVHWQKHIMSSVKVFVHVTMKIEPRSDGASPSNNPIVSLATLMAMNIASATAGRMKMLWRRP